MESLQSISVIKAFTTRTLKRNVTAMRWKSCFTAIRASHYRELFISFIILAIFSGIVAVAWYGQLLVQTHKDRAEELLSLHALHFHDQFPSQASATFTRNCSDRSAHRNAYWICCTSKTKRSLSTEIPRLAGSIRFENVSFSYPWLDFKVLKDLHFNSAWRKGSLGWTSGSGNRPSSACCCGLSHPARVYQRRR